MPHKRRRKPSAKLPDQLVVMNSVRKAMPRPSLVIVSKAQKSKRRKRLDIDREVENNLE